MRRRHLTIISLVLVLTMGIAMMSLLGCGKEVKIEPITRHLEYNVDTAESQQPAYDLNIRRINYLIYPTFGDPAIVKRGGQQVLEFDPRLRNWNGELPELGKSDFSVSLARSNGPAKGWSKILEVTDATKGPCQKWPEYAGSDIYNVTVEIPDHLPEGLYDLQIDAGKKSDGSWTYTDQQAHALQCVDEFKDHFSFVQLADIHVYGPEISYEGYNMHQRDYRSPKGEGAVYLQKAIEQINLMKPDFCIFTGDYVNSQYWIDHEYSEYGLGDMPEYQFEMSWFYQEALELEVPVFMVPGNHESYSYKGDSSEFKYDFQASWRDLWGPLYYSFDYGPDYHFVAINSADWDIENRNLFPTLPGFPFLPKKWQGQLLSGGDQWQQGEVTKERIDECNPDSFGGQLGWIRDDLEAHAEAKMRVVAIHHDPWSKNGEGEQWADTDVPFFGETWKSGEGEGRTAILRLMRDYDVAFEISGHQHVDNVGWASDLFDRPDSDPAIFINTTCTEFPEYGSDDSEYSYPGYRRIWINSGKLESYGYKEKKSEGKSVDWWSYPIYKDSDVGGDNADLEPTASVIEIKKESDTSYTVTNYLEKSLPDTMMEIRVPKLAGNEQYQPGPDCRFGDVYEGGDYVVYQVLTDVPAGSKDSGAVRKISIVK